MCIRDRDGQNHESSKLRFMICESLKKKLKKITDLVQKVISKKNDVGHIDVSRLNYGSPDFREFFDLDNLKNQKEITILMIF